MRTGTQITNSNPTGERGCMLQTLNAQIAELFGAIGLPAVQAPGEAEAMCAALQMAGLVQGCATKDSDTLALGASRVYHTINLAVSRCAACACTHVLCTNGHSSCRVVGQKVDVDTVCLDKYENSVTTRSAETPSSHQG